VEDHRVDQGGTVVLRGANLAAVGSVVFLGNKGRRDDVTVPTAGTDPNYAIANVPGSARSGPISAIAQGVPLSTRWSGLVIEDPRNGLKPYKQSSVPAPVEATVSQPRRISYGGMHKSVFTYEVSGQQAADVQVNLVRATDGALVRSWNEGRVTPNSLHRIVWDGSAKGKPLPEGRYFFQVVTPGAAPAPARARASATASDTIALENFVFPVQGRHDFGGSQSLFGAGRSGHSHAGHDVFAKCGTPLVVARAGKVIYSGYGGAAGYYVAIDGAGTGLDFAYMHLREHALVNAGDRVSTGQPLGYVGDTGAAQGCHLHFEVWTAPGWYKGGRPIDPLPLLKRWDKFS